MKESTWCSYYYVLGVKQSSNMIVVVQACVGMAYPPGNPNEQPTGPRDQIPETFPANNRPPLDVEHGDLHEANGRPPTLITRYWHKC